MEATTQPIDRGTWLALIAMGIAVFVIANDFSAINVAIPQIEKDFHTDVTTAQWVVNAYALTFGVLIVTGGRLADLFGRRRAFFIGAAIFATFSVARRRRAERGLADRDARADGHRGRADVARDPGDDLRRAARGASRAGRRLHPRRRRDRQRRRAPDRRRAHRPAQLALDLLPEPAGVGVRGLRHLAARSTSPARRSRTRGWTTAASLTRLGRPRLPAARLRPGDRLGLGRPADHRPARPLRAPDLELRRWSSAAPEITPWSRRT